MPCTIGHLALSSGGSQKVPLGGSILKTKKIHTYFRFLVNSCIILTTAIGTMAAFEPDNEQIDSSLEHWIFIGLPTTSQRAGRYRVHYL